MIGARHANLVQLLHRSPAQFREVGAAGNGEKGRFAVQRVGQPRNGIGETRAGVHANAQLTSGPAPAVGHVHRRLLVPGVHEPEVHVHHDVHGRQNVVAGQGEHVGYSFQFQGLAKQVASSYSNHAFLSWGALLRPGQAAGELGRRLYPGTGPGPEKGKAPDIGALLTVVLPV